MAAKCLTGREQSSSHVTKFIYSNYREQTIITHHNRIEQLRESYAKKLEASEKTCRVVRSPSIITDFLHCH
jgi:hypothetical protein